jgi:hypothetical protein
MTWLGVLALGQVLWELVKKLRIDVTPVGPLGLMEVDVGGQLNLRV